MKHVEINTGSGYRLVELELQYRLLGADKVRLAGRAHATRSIYTTLLGSLEAI